MRFYLYSFDLGDRPEELVALTGSVRRAAIIVNALDREANRDQLETTSFS
jgi:hypothetical protein